jgi:hypothetical protein
MKQAILQLRNNSPDLHTEMDDILVEDNRVLFDGPSVELIHKVRIRLLKKSGLRERKSAPNRLSFRQRFCG